MITVFSTSGVQKVELTNSFENFMKPSSKKKKKKSCFDLLSLLTLPLTLVCGASSKTNTGVSSYNTVLPIMHSCGSVTHRFEF